MNRSNSGRKAFGRITSSMVAAIVFLGPTLSRDSAPNGDDARFGCQGSICGILRLAGHNCLTGMPPLSSFPLNLHPLIPRRMSLALRRLSLLCLCLCSPSERGRSSQHARATVFSSAVALCGPTLICIPDRRSFLAASRSGQHSGLQDYACYTPI